MGIITSKGERSRNVDRMIGAHRQAVKLTRFGNNAAWTT